MYRICGLGSAPNLAGGAYSTPPDSLAGRQGSRGPLPKNPSLLSAFQTSGVPRGKDMGSASNHNCCKGFHFTEKAEKYCNNPIPVLF